MLVNYFGWSDSAVIRDKTKIIACFKKVPTNHHLSLNFDIIFTELNNITIRGKPLSFTVILVFFEKKKMSQNFMTRLISIMTLNSSIGNVFYFPGT